MCDPDFDRESLTKDQLTALRQVVSNVSELYNNMGRALDGDGPKPCRSYILAYHNVLYAIDIALKQAITMTFEFLEEDMDEDEYMKLRESWNEDLMRELTLHLERGGFDA